MKQEGSNKRRNVGTYERRKNIVSKYMNKYNELSPLELSKLYLTVETKIVILSNVVLNLCRGNI